MASRSNTIKVNIEANSQGFTDAMKNVKSSMTMVRSEFKSVNELMKSSSQSTEELAKHKEVLTQELQKLEKNLGPLRDGLSKSIELFGEDSDATRIAREEVNKAETSYYSLKNQITEINKILSEQSSTLKNVSDKFKNASDSFDSIAKKFKWVSASAGAALGLMSKTAISYEDAFIGVKKTVDGTDEELEQVRKTLINLSEQIPLATTDIFELAETAGQLGIKTKDLSTFTETMSKLGSATNLSATEAGEAIATFVNVMGTLPENYERIGSVITRLGNNSKATESEIVSMAQRMSGAAATIKMSEADVLGIATALSSVGIEAEMGGTAISRIMNDFNKAANGVATKYGTISQYAKICGMSTKEFADTVKNNAGEAIKEFIKGLGDTSRTGKSTIHLMSELGIEEVRLTDTMLRLTNASGNVDEYLKMANQEWKENNALTAEASKKFADTKSQIEITKNKVNNLANSFGQLLLPSLNDIISGANKFVGWLGSLDSSTQKTIVKFTLFTAAIAPVSKGIGTVTKGISTFTNYLDKTSNPFKTLYTNITNVNSRTVDLSTNVKENTSLFVNFKNSISKAKNATQDYKTTISNLNTNLKSTTKQVKDGINYWYQTASATDKLKVGITGLVGTTISLKGFSESIKSISDNGATLGNVTGTITTGISTISSAASTGAAIGGAYGAAIGGIAASIGLVVTGISSWVTANDQSRANLETTKEVFSNFKTSIDSITDSYNQSTTSMQNSTSSQILYIEKMQQLTTEMSNLIDVNGRVKDSDSERANVIMTILNESLGTQLSLEDGVIKNGDKIISNKEEFIALTEQSAELIKKETLLQGYQSQYKEAIDAQTKAKREYNNALAEEEQNISNALKKYQENKISLSELEKIVNTSSKAKQEAEEKYQGVLNTTDHIINGLGEVTKNYATTSSAELEKTINKIISSNNKSLEETEKLYSETYKNVTKVAQDATDEILKRANELNKAFEKPSSFTIDADYSKARSQTNRFITDYNKALGGMSANGNNVTSFSKLKTIPANAQGTVIDKPTLSWVGEDGAEAIIPLEKHTGWINRVAEKFVPAINNLLPPRTIPNGFKDNRINTVGIANDYYTQMSNSLYNDKLLEKQIELLEKIYSKPSDFYVDGRKISKSLASYDDVESGNILEKLERGWAVQ